MKRFIIFIIGGVGGEDALLVDPSMGRTYSADTLEEAVVMAKTVLLSHGAYMEVMDLDSGRVARELRRGVGGGWVEVPHALSDKRYVVSRSRE